METIRNYLESMFRAMPDTPAVRRAKDELWQMMEDKYTECLAEGATENEAVGAVISEFGNLDELSELLGIADCMPGSGPQFKKNAAGRSRADNSGYNRSSQRFRELRQLTLAEVEDCLRTDRRSVIFRSIGIFCFIISVTGPILMDTISDYIGLSRFLEGIGVLGLFLMIAAGVGFNVYAGKLRVPRKYLHPGTCQISLETAMYLDEMVKTEAPKLSLLRWGGILLCVFSIFPPMILGSISGFFELLGVLLLFLMVGAGVMLIVFSASYLRTARRLLRLHVRTAA